MRILRAKSASENGMETLGMYAGGVIAANMANLDAYTLNALTLSYLASRLAYNFIYIRLQDNRSFAPLRSVAWGAGICLIFTLYIMAGMSMPSASLGA